MACSSASPEGQSATIIVDLPNEYAMFDALYDTWQLTKDYPSVTPVVVAEGLNHGPRPSTSIG